jgi:hypothetical protein
MKYMKMLAVLMGAAAISALGASVASATAITSPKGTVYTSKIKVESEGHGILHNAFTTVECSGSAEGTVEKHGFGVTASGPAMSLPFTQCTGSNTVTVQSAGALELHPISGTENGTLTSRGAEVVVFNHPFGGTCIYTSSSSGTDIGLVTSTSVTGGAGRIDVNAVIPRTAGSLGIFCGSSATLTANVKITSPNPFYVDA